MQLETSVHAKAKYVDARRYIGIKFFFLNVYSISTHKHLDCAGGCVGTLFYLTTLAGHFPSAELVNLVLTINNVFVVMGICKSKENISSAFFKYGE